MSSTEQNYNGWSNRETWLTFLWLTNDQGNYSVFLEALKLDVPAWRKAEWLRDFLEEQLNREISGPSIWKDLLVHAFRCVCWEEIIDNNEELI